MGFFLFVPSKNIIFVFLITQNYNNDMKNFRFQLKNKNIAAIVACFFS
jgi:hypothetical protein